MDVTSNQPVQTFCFPVLKSGEIIQCLSDLSIQLSEAELLEPSRHKDVVRETFIKLIDLGMGVNEAELFQPSQAALEFKSHLPYPELHEESLGELRFVRCCVKLMTTCGVTDFSVRDIHSPQPKRFKRHLSAAINLFKFREDKMMLYDELLQPRNQQLANLEHVRNEHAMLNQQLEEAKAASATNWNAIQEAKDDLAAVETDIANANQLQASIRHENAELKKRANELSDEIARAKLALQEIQTEEQRWSSQIVQSPKRIQEAVTKATRDLETERGALTNAEREVQQMRRGLEHVQKATVDVSKATEEMRGIKEEMTKLERVDRDVQSATSSIDDNGKKVKGLRDTAENLEHEIHRIEEKSAHLRKQGKIKMDAAQQALDKAQRDLLDVEKERRDGRARVEAGEAEVRAIEDRIKEERGRSELEIAEMIRRYRDVESAILEKEEMLMKEVGCT